MKKSRSKQMEKLQEQIQKASGNNYRDDEDDLFWKPIRDENGNFEGVIRFLPPCADEDEAYVRRFRHAFQGPTGKWYIEKSLTTIGQDDPVVQYRQSLYATGQEKDKEAAKLFKPQKKFVSNIYIEKDSKNPANNGTVKLFEYGQTIFDLIKEQMNPEFEGEEAINPFDFWDGASFALRIRMVDKYPKYDKSKFLAPAPLLGGDDEKLEAVYNQQHSLKALIDPAKFKSYDDLKAKFNMVMGFSGASAGGNYQRAEDLPEEDEDVLDNSRRMKEASSPKMKEAETVDNGDEDDEVDMFRKMAMRS